MKYDILLIAGTTESRQVIEEQLKENRKILASVATDLGAEMLQDYDVDIHIGRLDEKGFENLLLENPCGKVIDASHPFARIVTETVRQAAEALGIPYERYERRELSYDYDRIIHVADAAEAIAVINSMGDGDPVLLTTGVNTAGLYAKGVRNALSRVYIRVLDNENSLNGCQEAGYPADHVFGEMPPFSVEDNLRLIRQTGAKVLVSKDSGKTGGVDVKVESCRQAGIPMILIDRPREGGEIPRVLLAGANSGCGKTSITCGILKALTDRGLRVQPYKCGPDYIDPMLHSHITGRDCRNLDPFFSTEEDLYSLMAKDSVDADFTVCEGVMGYYDGIGVSSNKSTHTVSMATRTPTILIFNVKGMSHTMIPLMKGMIEYQDNPVKGVILNRCSKGLFQLMKPEIERELGIRVVGYFPYKEGMSIGSRHLGLMTAEEIGNLDQVIGMLGETAEEGIDLDVLLEIGREAKPMKRVAKPKIPDRKRARIAVARDKAFCFYYKENLEILEQLGAELVYFSPVEDEHLPDRIGGIYLGGGYPETYRDRLAANESMKIDIREAVEAGKPVVAECGGFMYACHNLVETDGSAKEMLNLIDTDVQMTRKLSMQFGYVTLTALKDTAFFAKDTKIRAHEFHYSKATERGDSCRIEKYSGKNWTGIYAQGHVLAGYPHFYFHNCRELAENFVKLAEPFYPER